MSGENNKIRVAIVGVGNSSSALVQGIHYYRDAESREDIPGLIHVKLGDYNISDIEFVAAFDNDENRVGKDLSTAIFSGHNNSYKFTEVPESGVTVERGMTRDSIGEYLNQNSGTLDDLASNVAEILKETGADILINLLPVGSEETTKWYAEQALKAEVGFVNAVPVFIASSKYWSDRFKDRGLPIIGDDIKSQIGATVIHQALTQLFKDRGVYLKRTFQLKAGGNSKILNTLERETFSSKEKSEIKAVTSILPYDIGQRNIHIGREENIDWLGDKKLTYIRMEGQAFGDVTLHAEIKLEAFDLLNVAGVLVDIIRLLKIGLDNDLEGALVEPSSYFMKSPPVQYHDSIAKEKIKSFIEKYQ